MQVHEPTALSIGADADRTRWEYLDKRVKDKASIEIAILANQEILSELATDSQRKQFEAAETRNQTQNKYRYRVVNIR